MEDHATAPFIVVVEEEIDGDRVGAFVGQCKWFNDRLGYGFITIQTGPDKGKDVFVHHSGVRPLNSNYKTLAKGEYVNFNIVAGGNGMQAIDVTGINGGTLMCDVAPMRSSSLAVASACATPAGPARGGALRTHAAFGSGFARVHPSRSWTAAGR